MGSASVQPIMENKLVRGLLCIEIKIRNVYRLNSMKQSRGKEFKYEFF